MFRVPNTSTEVIKAKVRNLESIDGNKIYMATDKCLFFDK